MIHTNQAAIAFGSEAILCLEWQEVPPTPRAIALAIGEKPWAYKAFLSGLRKCSLDRVASWLPRWAAVYPEIELVVRASGITAICPPLHKSSPFPDHIIP